MNTPDDTPDDTPAVVVARIAHATSVLQANHLSDGQAAAALAYLVGALVLATHLQEGMTDTEWVLVVAQAVETVTP